MAFTAGDFTASALHATVLAKIDALTVDTTQKHLIKDTSIINDLYQQPTFVAQTDEQKKFFSDARACQSLKLSWLLDGDTDAPNAAGTVDFCDPDGPEIGSDSVTYPKPTGKEKVFKVITDTCNSMHHFTEKVAYAFMSKRAILVEQLEKDAAAYLIANADTLTGLSVPIGGVTGSLWNVGVVGATEQDGLDAVKRMIHFSNVGKKLKMIRPTFVMGERFVYEHALYNANTGTGTAANYAGLLSGGFPIVRDIDNFDTAAGGNQDIIMMDKATVGYVNFSWAQNTAAPNQEMKLNHPIQFYIPDPVIKVWDPVSRSPQPYRWDVSMVWKCVTDNQFAVVYTITGRGGFLRAPKDVTDMQQIVHIRFEDN